MMFNNASMAFLFSAFGLALGLMLFAAALLIALPRAIASRTRQDAAKAKLDAEDRTRKLVAQIIGFPLGAIGAGTACAALIQGLTAYSETKIIEYQNQYQRGFEALASPSIATRIGGLYTLDSLLMDAKEKPLPFQRNNDPNSEQFLLRALAGFAVSHPASSAGIVEPDSLVALQIIAYNDTAFGLDLRTGKFSGSILSNDAQHKRAHFDNFDFFAADLSGSDLYKATLRQANLRRANFDGSNLPLADLSSAGLSNTRFCPGLNYSVPALAHSYPVRAQLANVKLPDSMGEDSIFDGAWMDEADFQRARLTRPSFIQTELYRADFSDSTLDKPDFTGAWLQMVKFDRTILINPQFNGAFIEDVDLRASGRTDQEFHGAYYCRVTMPSGEIRSSDCQLESQQHLDNDPKKSDLKLTENCTKKWDDHFRPN